eukprot:TRINITY_DN5992_c0_g1_i1.p1 TRINITY_DN5992_c0_g1~~TRINITY_DN5992_c0_g1_i1.p1  ORF type:complete len:127 (-),score=7.93 TRINITY_DN5992_c0_g1_i1:1195-1530(-)
MTSFYCRVAILVCFCALFVLVSGAVDTDSRVHFEDEAINSVEKRQANVSRCSKPCPRILRPVRGIQNGRAVLLPNMCEFKNAQCRANDSRTSSPLLLAEDQSNINWPVTNT